MTNRNTVVKEILRQQFWGRSCHHWQRTCKNCHCYVIKNFKALYYTFFGRRIVGFDYLEGRFPIMIYLQCPTVSHIELQMNCFLVLITGQTCLFFCTEVLHAKLPNGGTSQPNLLNIQCLTIHSTTERWAGTCIYIQHLTSTCSWIVFRIAY